MKRLWAYLGTWRAFLSKSSRALFSFVKLRKSQKNFRTPKKYKKHAFFCLIDFIIYFRFWISYGEHVVKQKKKNNENKIPITDHIPLPHFYDYDYCYYFIIIFRSIHIRGASYILHARIDCKMKIKVNRFLFITLHKRLLPSTFWLSTYIQHTYRKISNANQQ